MNLTKTILLGAAFALGLSGSLQAEGDVTADTALATVNGTDITIGHVIALRGRLPQQYQELPDEVLLNGIVEQLIQHTVLRDAIKDQLDKRTTLGLENEARAFLASEMLARISERDVAEEDIQAAYNEQYDAAIPDSEFDASHILVASREEAIALIALLEDGADFGALATEHSTGPSGKSGGSLGWFGKGQMVKPFEDAVLDLAVGEISPPVETQFGWHIVRLNDLRNIAIPTLDEVRNEIIAQIQETAIEAEIAALTDAANVTRHEVDIDPSVIRDVSLFE